MEIGGYVVDFNDEKDKLGQGAFAMVWRGKKGKTEVAVKRVPLGEDTEEDREWTRKYVDGEVEALKAINHKNVVKLLDTVKRGGLVYLFLEYCELGSLEKYVIKEKQLSEITTVSFMKDVAEAVRCMHEKRPPLIHRDIKPANLLVVKDSRMLASYSLKMTDFGTARRLTTFAETLCGSPNWMAPEVRPDSKGKIKYQTESDVFSTGLVDLSLLNHKRGKPLEAAKGKYKEYDTI